MGLHEDFLAAAEKAKNLSAKPTDEELLELYSLFKQAEIGDVNTQRPGMFDLKGKAKWDAWEKKKGTSQDDAKTKYIAHVENLAQKYGVN